MFVLLSGVVGCRSTRGSIRSREVTGPVKWNQYDSVREFVLDLLAGYSPDSLDIIADCADLPRKFTYKKGGSHCTIRLGESTDFMEWIEENELHAVLDRLGTSVHETYHGLSSILPYELLGERNKADPCGNRYYAFRIDADQSYLVRGVKVFPSAEMKGTIPKSLRTHRFETYIHPSRPRQSTQVSGIYGLLDELYAYYHGTRTHFELLEFYTDEMKMCPETWFHFFANVNGTYFAYLEFKLYILKYLLYAKKHHKKTYRKLLNERELMRAIVSVDRHFSELTKEYFSAKKGIYKQLLDAGYSVEENDKYVMIGSKGRKEGRGNFLKQYKKLKKELKKKKYRKLMGKIRKQAREET